MPAFCRKILAAWIIDVFVLDSFDGSVDVVFITLDYGDFSKRGHGKLDYFRETFGREFSLAAANRRPSRSMLPCRVAVAIVVVRDYNISTWLQLLLFLARSFNFLPSPHVNRLLPDHFRRRRFFISSDLVNSSQFQKTVMRALKTKRETPLCCLFDDERFFSTFYAAISLISKRFAI